MPNTPVDHHSLFEHVYTLAPFGIALVAIDGTTMKVNQAIITMFGYSKDELMQLTYQQLSYPEDLALDIANVERLLAGEATFYEMEKRYIRKNGTILWASLHVTLVRNESEGTPLYFISHVIDITDKKANEHDLSVVNELYKLLSENARDIITLSSPQGVVEYISPSIYDVLGYRPEEIVGSTVHYLYHPDDLAGLQARSFSDNDVFTCRVLHKNGNYVWMETTFKKTRDAQGNELKTLAIGRDITERKKHEENLAEAQRIAALGSWEWDIVQNETTFSEEVYRIYNLAQKHDWSSFSQLIHLVHPNDQQRLRNAVKQALNGQELNMEIRHQQADGSIKYIHIRGIVTRDEQGQPVKMNGTVQDITDRKLVELKLQESIERYTSLKKYNHDAVISLDVEGNIINANKIAQQFTGYSANEMAGVNLSKFIGVSNLNKILTISTTNGHSENDIDKIMHKDGHSIEVLTTIAPIIINNETVGYYIIAKDITEQKKLIIAKEAAERTNRAKSEFLAMMSHEIRTPMNGVIGMTQLLTDTTELDEQQKEYVDIIRKSGDSLLTLISDILDFSRIESGKTELQQEVLDIRDCVAETIDVVWSKAQHKQLDVSFSVKTDVPGSLIGDPARIRQVFLNLIGNAIKFTYTGGVSITVEKVRQLHETGKAKEQDKVLLKCTIKDSGIGIPSAKINRLFEPFYQLENFMTRKAEGTGLGLAISKKLVELMGGNIWVEAMDEPGATFVFTLELLEVNKSTTSAVGETDEQSNASKRLNILVAEDHEINQLVLKKMLENLGHSVTVVENGQKVIQAVAYETYDLIFMDVQMPIMNGFDATRTIKQMLTRDKCPIIIAVTANALTGDREKCLAAGMDDYISKPIKSETIAETISRHFSKI